jgi:hypothetical protein
MARTKSRFGATASKRAVSGISMASRHAVAHAFRCGRPAQRWQRRDDDDQSAGRHRRGYCRHQAQAQIQSRCAERRSGRNSDNTLVTAKLSWAPSIPLRVGMEQTYRWIYDQAKARDEGRPTLRPPRDSFNCWPHAQSPRPRRGIPSVYRSSATSRNRVLGRSLAPCVIQVHR